MKMNKNILKTHPILSIINNSLIKLPSPSNINFFWNFGSLLGLCLIIQIITGIFLSLHYTPHIEIAFHSINHIMRDINYGWLMRMTHMNGASFFFICIYTHIMRNIYYDSFILKSTWFVGVIILFLLMMTAFLGYILPWGQMSYWGATVITNLLSAIPYAGNLLTQWIWGGFTINNATLNRFFSFHFILPFILLALIMIHLMFLHETGSTNPLSISLNIDKIPFSPYFIIKDLMGYFIFMLIFTSLIMLNPNFLGDSDNFIMTNPLSTPEHIQPEWYFLFAYAILRSIPNKLGGVIALILSIMVLMILPLTFNKKIKTNTFYYPNKIYFWMLINNLILLTWIGMNPVEEPYIIMGQMLTLSYFSYYIFNPILNKIWEKLII
uniref:cytochrome b n=1 Tax=Hydroptila angulata TaxID=1875522 RepID=UPI0022DCE299|nr:cytochrome b [Hydroptila angulata]UZZ44050.1 cytochrome b [Hydroptila angulata]